MRLKVVSVLTNPVIVEKDGKRVYDNTIQGDKLAFKAVLCDEKPNATIKIHVPDTDKESNAITEMLQAEGYAIIACDDQRINPGDVVEMKFLVSPVIKQEVLIGEE